MAKQVAFKPISDYKGNNQYPLASNFSNYNLPTLINNLSCRQISTYAVDTTGGSTTIYTVPAGKVFVLQCVVMQGRIRVAGGSGDVYISTSQDGVTRLLTGTLNATYNPDIDLSMSYPFGLIFKAGQTISVNSGSGDISIWGSIAGFELPANQF